MQKYWNTQIPLACPPHRQVLGYKQYHPQPPQLLLQCEVTALITSRHEYWTPSLFLLLIYMSSTSRQVSALASRLAAMDEEHLFLKEESLHCCCLPGGKKCSWMVKAVHWVGFQWLLPFGGCDILWSQTWTSHSLWYTRCPLKGHHGLGGECT